MLDLVILETDGIKLMKRVPELPHVLSLNTGRVPAYEALVRQVSRKHCSRDAKVALRSLVRNRRRKLADDADDPDYILNERGGSYRMPGPDGP